MIAATGTIAQLIRPGVEQAVDRAVHEADPVRFHRRVNGVCPLCLTLGEQLAQAFKTAVPGTAVAEAAKESLQRVMEIQDARFG